MLFTTFLHAAFNTNEEERRRLPYFFADWDFLPSIGGNAEHHLSVFIIWSLLKPRNNFVHDVKLDSRSLAKSVNEVTFFFRAPVFVVSSTEIVVNTPTTATFGVLVLQTQC